jgi:SAM-dependent methyltransferase
MSEALDDDLDHEADHDADHVRTAAKFDNRWKTRRPKWGALPQVRAYFARRLGASSANVQTAVTLAERLARIAPPKPRAISIGCGPATTEIAMLKAGAVDRFVVYDLSEEALARAKKTAEAAGLGDRLECRLGDAFQDENIGTFDVVLWKSALHHMYDTRAAIAWSRDRLEAGGAFFAFEYVGPSRFQYDAVLLRHCTNLMRMIPDHIMSPPEDSGLRKLRKRVKSRSPEQIAAQDPSEAVDSGNILPAFRELMPEGKITAMGGAVARQMLIPMLANLDPERDARVIDFILAADEMLAEQGVFHNACLEWVKPG